MQEVFEKAPDIDPKALPFGGKVNHDQIVALSDRLERLITQVAAKAFKPAGAKKSPMFNQAQLAGLCRLSPDAMARRLAKAEDNGLPPGQFHQKAPAEPVSIPGEATHPGEVPTKGRKLWTLAEARQWVQACNIPFRRKPGMPGCVITTALFKGGVGKTFTSVSLAQGLSLMGYRTLIIDLDPQGSASSLLGVMSTEVSNDMTVLPIFAPPLTDVQTAAMRQVAKAEAEAEGVEYLDPCDPANNTELPRSTIKESIRPTYWSGLDMICANRKLFSGEFYLPSRQMREPGFKFWDVLNRALNDGTRQAYDYIVIDTPPALSYSTLNCLWASDGVLMPLPPEGLDLASSSQYWNMFVELSDQMPETERKEFSFIGVLPSKVDRSKAHTETILQWIRMGYGEMVLAAEIPMTQVVGMAGAEFSTVYDITKYVGAAKTYARAREAYDRLVAEIDDRTRRTCWGE